MENVVTFTDSKELKFTAPPPLGTITQPSETSASASTAVPTIVPPTSNTVVEPRAVKALAGSTDPSIKLYPVAPIDAVPQVVDYKTTLTNKVSDALENLNISAAASVKFGSVTASGSGAFVQEDKVKQSSLTYILTVKVMNDLVQPDTSTLTFNKVDSVIEDKEQFIKSYGDGFISGWVKGGEFNAIVSMVTKDTDSVEHIKASLSVQMTAFQGEGQGGFDKTSSDALSEVNYAVNWRGGGQIKDPQQEWNMTSLFQAATEFPARVSAHPEYCEFTLPPVPGHSFKYQLSRYILNTDNNAGYAIITKWDHLKDFHKYTPSWWTASSLDYDMAAVYTNDLLDQFLEYKSLLKQVSDIASNLTDYQVSASPNAVPVEIGALLGMKKLIKKEMAMITREIDFVTQNPQRAIDAVLAQADDEKHPQVTSGPSSSHSSDSAVVVNPPKAKDSVPGASVNSNPPPPPPFQNITDPQIIAVQLPLSKDAPHGGNQGSKPMIMAGNPKAYRTPSGLTEIFAVAGDGLLYRKWINEPPQGVVTRSSPGSWELFTPSNTVSLTGNHDIAAIYRGNSSVDLRDIFALGVDRKLWHKMYANGQWQPWKKVNDTTYASAPSVISTKLGRIDIAIRTLDATIHWLNLVGDTWTTKELSLGRTWYGEPYLINLNDDSGSTRLYCVSQVADSNMFRITLQDGQDPAPPARLEESNVLSLSMSSVTAPGKNDVGLLVWTGAGEVGTWCAQHVWGHDYAQGTRVWLESRDMLSAPVAVVTDTNCFVLAVRGRDVPANTDPNGKGKVVCHMTDTSFDPKQLGAVNDRAKFVISQVIYNSPCAVAYGSQVDVFACGMNGDLWKSHYDGKDWVSVDERI